MLGSEFHANARYLVQKLENGYVILLPGVAFEKDGKVKTEEGSLVFGTEKRPDPHINYEAVLQATSHGDYNTVRHYISSLVSDDHVREILEPSGAFAGLGEKGLLSTLSSSGAKADFMEMIDPNVVVLHFTEQKWRIAVYWEDEMWKMLPEPGLESLYEDYKRGL